MSTQYRLWLPTSQQGPSPSCATGTRGPAGRAASRCGSAGHHCLKEDGGPGRTATQSISTFISAAALPPQSFWLAAAGGSARRRRRSSRRSRLCRPGKPRSGPRPAPDLSVLLDDARFWIEHNTYPPDETAVRVHHRLVWIHPFPNGNGRHARLMADLLIEKLGGEAFSWGGGSLADVSKLRTRYIAALQTADGYDIGPLLAFARS